MSKILLELAHKMLSNIDMARRFLANALSMTSYLVHKSPSIVIRSQTPKNVWSNNVADYSVIKIFGKIFGCLW